MLARLAGLGVAQPHAGDGRARRAPPRRRTASAARSCRFARARLTMICEARNSLRRWTSVTFVPKRVRNSASSNAESPPPTTTIVLLLEERAVAGRAGRDAAALQALLRLEPEPARARAGRDDHGLRPVLVAADPDAERPLGKVDLRQVIVCVRVHSPHASVASQVCVITRKQLLPVVVLPTEILSLLHYMRRSQSAR